MKLSKPVLAMNLKELKKIIKELSDDLSGGVSKEQYAALKKRLDEVRETIKSNPLVAMIGETVIAPLSREMERVYKTFTGEDKADTKSYEGFDLVNDPKAPQKIVQYLETVEASAASMTPAQFSQALEPLSKLVDDLEHLKPENAEEERFAKDVRQRVLKLVLSSKRAQTPTDTIKVYTEEEVVYEYTTTDFDIFASDFFTKYRAYMEDVALNSANKTVNQLLKDGQTLNIIAKDLNNTQPETPVDVEFLREVAVQTPLLLKIVDRQIALKSTPAAPTSSTGQPAPKAKKATKATKAVRKEQPKPAKAVAPVAKATKKATKAVKTPAKATDKKKAKP